ncbi:MAG: DUF2630 family protein [Actinomycetota bacterium]|nr:DUF2630 family protein [Actinomycetota bacterium]
MRDDDLLERIQALVDREHELRDGGDPVDEDEERRLEEQLDQCWDLLRQRRALRSAGEDPDAASPRSIDTVEGYRQ